MEMETSVLRANLIEVAHGPAVDTMVAAGFAAQDTFYLESDEAETVLLIQKVADLI